MLTDCPDRKIADLLLEDFTNGFKLKYSGPMITLIFINILSAEESKEALHDKLDICHFQKI